MVQVHFAGAIQRGFRSASRRRLSTTIVVAAAIVMLTFGLVSCGSQGAGANPPLMMEETLPPENSPAPTVAETPERYEGSDFELSEPLPEDLQYLQALSPEEFAKADKYDQMRWATWAL